MLGAWGSGAAWAQRSATPVFPSFTLTGDSAGRIEVGTKMGVLVDPDQTLTLQQVSEPQARWTTIDRSSPNFGFTADAYWFRFQIENTSQAKVARLIELPISFLDDVRLFHIVNGQVNTQYALGDEQPFAQRPIRNPNFIMPLALAPGNNQIYVRLASTGTIEATLRVWNPLKFHEASRDESLFQGVVTGILLVMIAYNLFLFFSIRDISYLFFIGFVASYLLFHLTLSGYTFAYLWPNAIAWNSFAISTFVALSALFTCLVANSFLKLKSFSPTAHSFVKALTWACALLVVLTFFLPYSLTIRVGASIVIPLAMTALVLGYWRWWRGAKFARFYCLAWTSVLVGMSVLSAEKFGLLPSNLWTINASQIGIVLQAVLLSFTLADRINSDRALRLDAQAVALNLERAARVSQTALIHAKEEANVELEKRVQARTLDLNHTLAQLQVANDRLKHLSATDGLTQLSNRAFFDDAFSNEHRRATRTRTSLCIILFDIDHFKQVNDHFGHPAGDACLRAIGDLLRARVLRTGDVVARYGGEEFVLLRINSSLDNAIALAQELRAEIQNLSIEFEAQSIRLSASFGVACSLPDARNSTQDLLGAADKALYQAKHDGRNCVRVGGTTPTVV